MVDILLLQTVSILVTSAGLLIAALYYVLQIRHQTKMRQTDLVMRLYTTFGSKEYLEAYTNVRTMEFKDYNDFEEKYGWTDVSLIGVFFEGVGVLLHRELIDIELVDDLFTGPSKIIWNKIRQLVEVTREKASYPQLYEWFEYLYNELQKREQQLQRGVKSG